MRIPVVGSAIWHMAQAVCLQRYRLDQRGGQRFIDFST